VQRFTQFNGFNLQVQPAFGVYGNSADAMLQDFVNFTLLGDLELVDQKRMLHPAALQVVDKHPDAQLFSCNAIDHGVSSIDSRSFIKISVAAGYSRGSADVWIIRST
jgi:hypothetical protein